MAGKTITVRNGQTIYDIAIQEYGSIDGTRLLLADNPTLGYSSVLQAGSLLKIKSKPLNKSVVSFYESQDYQPASMLPGESRIGRTFSVEFTFEFL